jgi:hypothetical protein
MMNFSALSLVSSASYFIGGCILLNYQDASHVSYKTVQLMFLQLLLQIPPFHYLGYEDIVGSLFTYAWNVLAFATVHWAFNKEGSRLKTTYSQHLDDFPFHWLLVLPPLIVPIVITFSIPNGQEFFGICSPALYQDIGGICSWVGVWAFNFSVTPFVFLPQLRLCHNVRKGGGEIRRNVKLFLYCMMLSSASMLVLTIFQKFLWPITSIAGGSTIFLLGTPFLGDTWLCNCFCERGTKRNEETGDVEMQNEGQGIGASVATEEYDLPTINKINSPTSSRGDSVATNNASTGNKNEAAAAEAGDFQTPSWLSLS